MHNETPDVVIIGGGVIGLACGLALQHAGRQVTVLEAGVAGCGSSHGNCGTITPSHAMPLAGPGTVARAVRWMLTPDAPLYVRPRLDPLLWAWLLQLAGRCNTTDWLDAGKAKAAILMASRQQLSDWIARYQLDCEFAAIGTDHVFRSEAALVAFDRDLPVLADLGIASEHIGGPHYLLQEPSVREGVVGAVHFPGDASLRPDRFVAELARALREEGGRIVEHCPVDGVSGRGDAMRVHAAGATYEARDVVLAVGAWSPRLGRALLPGLDVLRRVMQPGKGYSITYDRPVLTPRRPLVLHERSVCVTSWEHGFRLGSTMEFSGYDASLNRRRLDALERGAREYLREPTGATVTEEWYGWRPMTSDDLPIIGAVPGQPHLWLATGHGMLGVSMSATTAELIAHLITGRAPPIDPAPYRLERFPA
ncbi:MAG: NAD(P)-binding Rossmann-like domain protein [Xanthomonadaceae bacterium]|nr:NAD(P)-binding Rossmann-like domain protein [Xanthomonadaceae bacterium]